MYGIRYVIHFPQESSIVMIILSRPRDTVCPTSSGAPHGQPEWTMTQLPTPRRTGWAHPRESRNPDTYAYTCMNSRYR